MYNPFAKTPRHYFVICGSQSTQRPISTATIRAAYPQWQPGIRRLTRSDGTIITFQAVR